MTSKPLTQIQEIPSEIRDICQFLVLFWYIVHVVLLTCSCRRIYSSKYFLPISFLYLHFSLPCLHRIRSIFSRIKFRQLLSKLLWQHLCTLFIFSHISVFSLYISLFETLFNQGNNKLNQTFLVLCNNMFKPYLFALQFLLSIV